MAFSVALRGCYSNPLVHFNVFVICLVELFGCSDDVDMSHRKEHPIQQDRALTFVLQYWARTMCKKKRRQLRAQ